MDVATALWILLPLAAIHAALARNRLALRFQVLLDVVLLLVPLRPLASGAHLGPGVDAAVEWGAPRTLSGSPEQTDLPLESEVWFAEVRRLVAAGHAPWISDRIGGGVPLFANAQSTALFPLQAPTWVLGPERGTDVASTWRIELAALGAFLLARRLRCGGFASAVAGVAFGLNLYLMSWLVTPIGWVIAATPWAWCLLVGTLRGRRREAALLAVVLGVLAGWTVHPETAAFLWLGVGLGGVLLAWGRRRRLQRLGVSLALGAAVSCVGALPTLAYIAGSSKLTGLSTGPQYPMPGVDWSLRGRLAALAVVPWREGHPADGTWDLGFASAAVEVSAGAGTLAAALAARPRRRHRRHALALTTTAGAAACLLWQLPGVAQVLARVPVIGVMMWPRGAYLLPFGIAMLGALSLDAWRRRPERRRSTAAALGVSAVALALAATAVATAGRRVTASAAAPAALLAAQALPVGMAAPAITAIVAAEALAASWDVLPASTAADWGHPPPLVAELQHDVAAEGGRVIGTGISLPPNLAARWGLSDLRSHDPMRPRALAELHAAFGSPGHDLMGPLSHPWSGLAGAWGVRWLVTADSPLPAGVGEGWTLVVRRDGQRIYRNTRALPVTRLAGRAVVRPGDPGAGAWEGVDFATTAVLDEPPGISGSGTIDVAEDGVDSARFRVTAAGTVLLVRHVPLAPGWHATIDGAATPLLGADLGAMAVAVPAGTHDVRFRYRPPGIGAGAAITALALAACAWMARRRRRT